MSDALPPVPPQQAPTNPAPGSSPAPVFDLKGIADAFVRVLTRPAAFWASVSEQKGFGPPIIFAVVMGVIAGVIGAILAIAGLGALMGGMGRAIGTVAGLVGIITTPILYVVGCFIGGGVVYLIAMIAGGKPDYERSVRIASYAIAVGPIGAILGFIPLLSLLPGLYGLYLIALGVIALQLGDRRKTFIAAGVLAGLLVLFQLIGFFTAMALRSSGSQLETRYGEGSQFQRDVERSAEEIRQKMEKAAREAQEKEER